MTVPCADPIPKSDIHSPLSAGDLSIVCDFIYQLTGMKFGESKRYYVDRRVTDRMARRHTPMFVDYHALLQRDPGEVEKLINSFTVNETYFYREKHQLVCLSRSILPEIIGSKRPGDKIRIWSVPCSSGEEPYSIAIWLLENWELVDTFNVEIVGSDIDTDILSEAVEASYGQRSVMRLPPDLIDRYFEPMVDGRMRLIEDICESVTFSMTNITDAASVARQGRFDVIFCRNLLIYFDEPGRARCMESLFETLLPGGYMCLGHSESMSRISERFVTRRFPEAIVYQRPGDT